MAEPSINTIEDLDIETKILMLKGEKGDPGGATWGNISGNINSQTDLKTALDAKASTSDLGDVCFSNSYNDLSNKPTYATVATTGSYNDLSNKPTIPTKTSQLTNNSGFLTPDTLADILLDYIYPVGSYYWSSNSINPGTVFGGTWEQVKDKFVLAAGDDHVINETGGEETHTLTEQEMPYHEHTTCKWGGRFAWGGVDSTMFGSGSGYQTELNHVVTGGCGGSQAHNNMPPYIVAYCWNRIA